MDNFERFKISLEEITADVEKPRELKLEVEPEDVTALPQSSGKLEQSLLFCISKESSFLRWNLILVKML